jgi:cytochrome P450 family 714 subfamily C
MVNMMVEAGSTMLKLWEGEVEREGVSAEMVVDEYLRSLSADVISRASFGSSFAEGKEIFNKIRQLQMLMSKQNMLRCVPGCRY